MKKSFSIFSIFSIFSTLFLSCNEKELKDGNVTINVTIKGLTKGELVIEKLPVGPKTIQLDTISVSKEGKAIFNINEDEAGFYSIYLIDKKGQIKFIAKKGNIINISADAKAITASAKVEGSAENLRLDSLKTFLSASKYYSDSIVHIYEEFQAKQMHYQIYDHIKRLLTNADRKKTNYVLKYISSNPSQLSNLIALNSLNRDYFRDIYKMVEEKLTVKYPNSEYVLRLKSENTKFFPPGVGERAPNFVLPNEKGETKSLKSFEGKYILLDFWATWCRPCIQEIPHLKKAQSYFKEREFEIISICIDKNTDVQKAIWKETIKKHEADWTQLYEETESTLRKYKIKNFPTLILISPEGEIIERGNTLRGDNNINTISKFMMNEK
tara:strand:- start:1467 stop:2615 length:1149 start_codon:yes stop_codon:yes gene_type:complete